MTDDDRLSELESAVLAHAARLADIERRASAHEDAMRAMQGAVNTLQTRGLEQHEAIKRALENSEAANRAAADALAVVRVALGLSTAPPPSPTP